MEESELSKYMMNSVSAEVMRSEIHFSNYNPRIISKESQKTLKRGIKKFGLVGGIVINKRTNNTIVQGHQRITAMDDLHKFDPVTMENDYRLRVEVVDLDLKEEEELNILLNNPNAQGDWDYDKLAQLVPDIDYKVAGLTEADLSMIGLEYLYQTDAQSGTADELNDLMSPVQQQHEEEVKRNAEARTAAREAEKAAEAEIAQQSANAAQIAQQEADREARVQHMKDVKKQVQEQAVENAQNMDAYLVLSFSTFKAKAEFCQRFGYNAMERTIKGEDFDSRCEVSMDGDGEDYEDD